MSQFCTNFRKPGKNIAVLAILVGCYFGTHSLYAQVSGSSPAAQAAPAQVMNQYAEAANGGVTPALGQQFYTAFQQISEQAKAQLRTTPDKAREAYKALYGALASPTGQELFKQSPGASSYQEIAAELVKNYAEADALLARKMATSMGMQKQVQELYAEAVALTRQQNAAYLLGLGNSARVNSDMDTAFNAFKAVLDLPSANKQQVEDARAGLTLIETATAGRLTLPKQTPQPVISGPVVTPVAGPGQTAMSPTVSSPAGTAPAPTVIQAGNDAPTTSGMELNFKSIMASIKDGTILNRGSELASRYLTGDLLTVVGLVIGLFLVLWVLPYQVLKLMARRGDNEAGNRLLHAKKLGFMAFVPYLAARVAAVRSTKHRCPFCNKGIDNMEDYNDLNFVVCPHCREPITPIYNMKDYIDHLIEQLKLSQKRGNKGQRGDVLIEKDAMLKLVRGVLSYCIRRRASDFHLETGNEGGRVRARIDGIMYDLITLPREITPAFISALKVMANLDITERRIPQDGKIPLWIDNQDFDLRINTSPASMGEKVVIRILRQDAINITPEKLGLEGENLAIYDRNIHKPHGVIIVTGPSGSGKSTSLYVALNKLNTGDKNIVTIEDPIEYQLKGLSQMQVNPGANFTFATGLRSILRQDPDVIMVGEIRDKETAEAALDAAMTGHMVLTTLHTIDAPTAFSRMKDLGIDQGRIASAVNLVMAQRLVRTICSDCRKSYKPKPEDLAALGLDKDEQEIQFVHGAGCETCMNTGYYGRLAIFEMLELNDKIRALLETNGATTAVREAARDNGMNSLREEGLRQVRLGVTTVEEVIRVTT